MTTQIIRSGSEWSNASDVTSTASSQASGAVRLFGEGPKTGTVGARVFHFDAPKSAAAKVNDGFADLLAEMEADPESAQALAEGRQWVAEQFYSKASTLASLRLAAGLSQKQLGAIIGMKQSHISRYEAGNLEPRLSTAHELAQALGVDLDTYFRAWRATSESIQDQP